MTLKILGILAGLSFASAAQAAGCESNFVKNGNFPFARHYSSQVSITGLTRQIAFSQLPIILADQHVQVRQSDPVTGIIIGEVPSAPFVPSQAITAQFSEAGGIGSVRLDYSIKPDVMMSTNNMTQEICGALGRLTDGSGRRPIESPARLSYAPVANGQMIAPAPLPEPIESRQFANQMLSIKDNPARIALNYAKKRFRVSGKVVSISEDYRGYAVRLEGVAFSSADEDIPSSNEMMVVCHVPLAQISAAAALTPNQRGTLVGRFDRLENHSRLPVISLEDCGR
jgi:hypothetical protein